MSAKAPVQLMHFRRMTFSFRGRVRSHRCLFQSQFQWQPFPRELAPSISPMSAAPTDICFSHNSNGSLPRMLAPSRGPTSAVDLWERTCPESAGTADAFPAHDTQLSRTSPLPRMCVSIIISMSASPKGVGSIQKPNGSLSHGCLFNQNSNVTRRHRLCFVPSSILARPGLPIAPKKKTNHPASLSSYVPVPYPPFSRTTGLAASAVYSDTPYIRRRGFPHAMEKRTSQ